MRNYIKGIHNNYSIFKQLNISVIISLIILVLDILQIPSEILTRYKLSLIVIISFAIIIFVVLTLIENNVIDVFKIPSINHFDSLLFISIFSVIIYVSIMYFLKELYLYKIIVVSAIFTVLLIGSYLRSNKYNKVLKKSKKYKSNIIDLKDLYEGKIEEVKGDDIVLFDEKDVDYDLLGRDKVINHLYTAIRLANPDGNFVISLEGKWGSGKTTIIRNVIKMIDKNMNDIIIIDEFDPWTYSNEGALLTNMFNIIIQKSGFRYNTLFAKGLAEDLSDLVLGTNKKGVINSIFAENSITHIKEKINNYLRLYGKKIVFFIDNIDRAEKENVILLFKLVGNVLDFERVTYVLSFDDERVKEIFKEDLSLDYSYLKKIIQLQIRIPEIDKEILNKVYNISLKNLLTTYGESKERFNKYDSIINIMSGQKLDIRDFKRFINSVLSLSFNINHYLYKRDLLVIEYIKLFNLQLYLDIYNNRRYFISHDQIFDKGTYYDVFNRERFNSESKVFFEELFANKENKVYIDILSQVFPYVNEFKNDQKIVTIEEITVEDADYSNISRYKRICSAKYFDLYFTNTSNQFVVVGELVETFIKDINESESFIDKKYIFEKILNTLHHSYQIEIFERIQIYLDDLESESVFAFTKILFEHIEYIDDSLMFFGLNARNRAEIIIYELLNKISNEQYDEFLEDIKEDYKKIRIIENILNWFEHDKKGINLDGREVGLEKLYNNMGKNIINKDINLYDNQYYMSKNIWGFYNIYKEDEEKMKEYTKTILNKDNIFRFLYDLMGVSYSNDYKYYINENNLNRLITAKEIDNILNNIEPNSDDEKFVLKVYNSYKEDIKDVFERSGVTVYQEIKLQL